MSFRHRLIHLIKRHRLVAALLAVALVVACGAVVVTVLKPKTITADCSRLERETAEEASSLAASCDQKVEVLTERTPWVSTFAKPDGSSQMRVDTVARRTDVAGDWRTLDTRIGRVGSAHPRLSATAEAAGLHTEKKMLPVAAPVFPMWFNPGGSEGTGLPLGVISRGNKWVRMWFPLELPKPRVEGNAVSYTLSDGVRLVVTVGADGAEFRPIVHLANADAAGWFHRALQRARSAQKLPGVDFDIPYRVETSPGLQLRGVDKVGFEVTGADGKVLFWSPPSTMWDSSSGRKASERQDFPVPGDRAVHMPVTVTTTGDGREIVLISPTASVFVDPQTVWPVHIDPTLGGRTPVEWVAIRTGGFTSPLYKWTDTATRKGESMGHCNLSWSSDCVVTFTSRLVWEFGGDLATWFTNLSGSDIISASFTADPGGRGSCVSTRTDAYLTYSITPARQTWSTMVFATYLAQITAPQGDACSDAGVRRSWDVTSGVKTVADNNGDAIAIGLKANNESSSDSYKTYQANAQLNIDYNRPPHAPTNVQLASPVTGCQSGAARPYIVSTTPTMSAVVSDPDGGNVQAKFQIVNAGTSTEVYNSGNLAAKASGSTFSVKVPEGKLTSEKSYQYRVMATDGTRSSSWSSAVCEFTVDITKPVPPLISPARSGAAAVYEPNVERGGVGLEGKFTLSRGSSTDVKSFAYAFNSTALSSTATPDAAGNAVVSYLPTSTGPVTIRVTSKDAAGNVSPQASYTFDVAAAKEDGIWMFDEGTGTTAADSSGVGSAKAMTISGAAWSTGPHELFQSRAGDRALTFDGADDEATTTPIVDTKKSFVISAYVRLDRSKVGAHAYTAVSQDGVLQSGLELSYLPGCTGGTGCWAFSMKNADSNSASSTTVKSASAAIGDRWVHLVAANDVSAKTITLWTCDIGTPDDPGMGVPMASTVARTVAPWTASGAFVLGRGMSNGTASNRWPGQVDNVRVFSGQVVSEAKIRRMCQGAEATDFGTGRDALDPTTDGE